MMIGVSAFFPEESLTHRRAHFPLKGIHSQLNDGARPLHLALPSNVAILLLPSFKCLAIDVFMFRLFFGLLLLAAAYRLVKSPANDDDRNLTLDLVRNKRREKNEVYFTVLYSKR